MKAWLAGWRGPGRAACARKALPAIFLLMATVPGVHGQDRAIIDSARRILNTARDACNCVDALNAWAFEYRRADVDSGIALAGEAHRLSSAAGYHKGLGGAYDCMTALVFNTHPDSSVIYGRLALTEFTRARDSAGLAESMMHLATAHLVGADYDSALHYARSCARLCFRNSALSLSTKRRRLISVQRLMGNIFYYMSYYDSSIIYARTAMQLAGQE